MNINKAIIVGNITKNPELKTLPSGMSVCSFSVATNRTHKDKSGAKQEQAEFHNVVAFGTHGENISKYMKQGGQIYVEGRLQTRSWDDNGKKMYRTEIIAENTQFGSTPKPIENNLAKGIYKNDTSDIDQWTSPGADGEKILVSDIPF